MILSWCCHYSIRYISWHHIILWLESQANILVAFHNKHLLIMCLWLHWVGPAGLSWAPSHVSSSAGATDMGCSTGGSSAFCYRCLGTTRTFSSTYMHSAGTLRRPWKLSLCQWYRHKYASINMWDLLKASIWNWHNDNITPAFMSWSKASYMNWPKVKWCSIF